MKRAKIVWQIPPALEQFDRGALGYQESAPRVREPSAEEGLWQALRKASGKGNNCGQMGPAAKSRGAL